MKTTSLTQASPSGAKIVVTSGGHQASAPAAALVPVELKVKRILVPFDFSEHSKAALRQALAIAHQFGAEVLLANVVELYAYPTEIATPPVGILEARRQEENLAELEKLCAELHLPAAPVVRVGSTWQELVNLAAEQNVDLIVIATHGRTGLSHVFLGSVAERVIQHAPCPVLTIRISKDALQSRQEKRAMAGRF